MKLEFYAETLEVRKTAKDHGYKWVLISGEQSMKEAIAAFAASNEYPAFKVTIEPMQSETLGKSNGE